MNEVYDAYLSGVAPAISAVDQLIPRATVLNPQPVYVLEENSLFLNQVSKRQKVDSIAGYLTHGLSQAFRYLPESYINGYIKKFITPLDFQIPPLIGQVVVPQIERFTGSIWHVIGLASYHQAHQESLELNEKIDEMASTLKATYDNSVQILKQMQHVNSQLDQLVWENLFREIGDAIATIKDVVHQHKIYQANLNQVQIVNAEVRLWSAHIRLSRVFSEGTAANGENLLAAYETMLRKTDSLNPSEIRANVTFWFRQMLDFQAQALSLYSTLQVIRNAPEKDMLPSQISQFESSLLNQLNVNEQYIDLSLIYRSQSYINMQIEKSKANKLALAKLNLLK